MLRFRLDEVPPSRGKAATTRGFRVVAAVVTAALLRFQAAGQDKLVHSGGLRPQTARVRIPRIERAPKLDDFLDMQPSAEWAGKLARVEGFIQRAPDDGKAATQRTDVYLGYDERRLYVIFVAHDAEPRKIRARLSEERTEGSWSESCKTSWGNAGSKG